MNEPRNTVVITGGNSGIGFETAKVLARRGWRVIITGRNQQRLEAAATKIASVISRHPGGEVEYRIGDFANFASVRSLAEQLNQEPRIDVLINNAGISIDQKLVTEDGNDMMLQVNHLAPFLLTNLLLDKLKASNPARIVNVASRLHRQADSHGFDDFQMEHSFATLRAYGRTKLYNILFTRELARRLEGTGVTANALHPGILATQIGDFTGLMALAWNLSKVFQLPQSMGARVPVYLASSPKVEGVTGKYFSRGLRPVSPAQLAQNDHAAERLWKISAKIVGLE